MPEENPQDAPEQVEEMAEQPVPVEEPEQVEEEPPKPRRGRPKGSKNKPKVPVVSVEAEEEPEVIPEVIPEAIPEPPKLKRQTNRQPKAKAAPATPEPAPPTQIDMAAFMLTALRQQQQERADRKREKYARWFS